MSFHAQTCNSKNAGRLAQPASAYGYSAHCFPNTALRRFRVGCPRRRGAPEGGTPAPARPAPARAGDPAGTCRRLGDARGTAEPNLAGRHFVDFDHSLHNAIARIREVLGDSAENPRYIETLPRRGYRHIGRVEDAQGMASRPTEPAPEQAASLPIRAPINTGSAVPGASKASNGRVRWGSSGMVILTLLCVAGSQGGSVGSNSTARATPSGRLQLSPFRISREIHRRIISQMA